MITEELIAALEKAEGPSRELDLAIFCLVASIDETFAVYWTDEQREEIVPRYTSSLDAIVGLIERELRPQHPVMTITISFRLNAPHDWFRTEITWPSHERSGIGRTAAIATCIAFLRARESQHG